CSRIRKHGPRHRGERELTGGPTARQRSSGEAEGGRATTAAKPGHLGRGESLGASVRPCRSLLATPSPGPPPRPQRGRVPEANSAPRHRGLRYLVRRAERGAVGNRGTWIHLLGTSR